MKKPKMNRDRRIKFRLSQEDYQHLHEKYKSTTCRTMSEFIRDILFNGEVTLFYRDKSEDEFLEVVINLKNELNRIGDNLNQIVKGIHISRDDEQVSAYLFSLEIELKILDHKMDEITHKVHARYQQIVTESRAPKPKSIGPILPVSDYAAAADQQENKSGQ